MYREKIFRKLLALKVLYIMINLSESNDFEHFEIAKA